MATKRPEFSWINGYQEIARQGHRTPNGHAENEEPAPADAYVSPPSVDLVTSPQHNSLGINVINSWPTMYDGTNSPHGIPSWWKAHDKVDVLICGAGPSGLGLAVSLLRQGVSFRIIDKADTPLACGRADGVQPRFLETASMFGLASEIHEEGPLIDRTAIYKDGENLLFARSHQSDSRYRGLHVITQGQIERIYIRDLLRHKSIVERSSVLSSVDIDASVSIEDATAYPVRATVQNQRTGVDQLIQAKYLVGTDGGASTVRKSINVPFDGVTTDIYWGIIDCIFDSDYPHAWIFGVVMSTEHGCCVIIPREDGYIRLYTKLNVSATGPISASRQARDPTFAESGGEVDAHSITPEEVLEQANRIFAPYTLKFASTLSWFSVWRISERVARSYSSPDMRVHLAGDAAHIHSVMGAFGLNASILDIANLGWKLGLAAKGYCKTSQLLPTYTSERREHAARIIKVSGDYLRFISGSSEEVPDLSNLEALRDTDDNGTDSSKSTPNGVNGVNGHIGDQVNGHKNEQNNDHSNHHTNGNTNAHDKGHTNGQVNGGNKLSSHADALAFMNDFFKNNGQFLLGVDCTYDQSVVTQDNIGVDLMQSHGHPVCLKVRSGVRAPNPRVCHSTNETGYLYDPMAGPSRFHLVLFASSLSSSSVRLQVNAFVAALRDPCGFYRRFGSSVNFHIVLVVKLLPFEYAELDASKNEFGFLATLKDIGATVVFDDRSPDESAHTTYGVNDATGAVAVIRPDLVMGTACCPGETDKLQKYFEGFLKEL